MSKMDQHVFVVVEDFYDDEVEGKDYENLFCNVFKDLKTAREYIKNTKTNNEVSGLKGFTYHIIRIKPR